MKRGYIVILIALWALAFVSFIDNSKDKEVDIVTAFSNDRFLSTNSHIEAVAYCGNVYYSDDAKKDMIISVAEKLGLKNCEYKNDIEDGTDTHYLIKNSKYALTEIKFVTAQNEKDALVTRQYIMVDINIINSLESAVVYREEVENILKEMNLEADVTLTLKGNISGVLSNSEKNNITDDIIDSLGGDIVTQKRDSEIYTVYAYSEKIEDYVVNGTSKTNINVAISYDETLNETNIYMATPIMNEDY